jgi:two-component system chemotaxis sensor kinase CheA
MAVNLDMSQFHEIFFEESREGLEAMESGLLNLNVGVPDPEVVNIVFRAAHSIKGAAGTFGFTNISRFTHVLESILDEVRSRKRGVTQELVDVLLQSVDGLRYMLDCAKAGAQVDENRIAAIQESLENLPVEQQPKPAGWQIHFIPRPHLLQTGNDPYRLFRELKALGNLFITPDFSRLPGIDKKEFDPENCYLGWDLMLQSDAGIEQIREIFAWVEGDCDLDINLSGERRQLVERRRRRDDESADALLESGRGQEQASIRVNIDKIDTLINLMGELVISQSILNHAVTDHDHDHDQTGRLKEIVELLEKNTWELQEQAMRIRMQSIDFTFQRLPRLVRDLCRSLGKQADLEISGGTTEVDKTVLEKINDPLVHLIRNAVDHGIETPGERKAGGKAESGLVEISAAQEGGNIIIKIKDDGAGLDTEKILAKAREKGLFTGAEELSMPQIHNLIFLPGFSTASKVSDVSGRGVGMDVVKRNINDLGGSIELVSEQGKGSAFTIKLPLTLAIMDGQLIRVGKEILIVPVLAIVESTQVKKQLLSAVAGKTEVYRFRDEYIPLMRLDNVYGLSSDLKDITDGLLVIVETGQQRMGLLADEILSQQQVVIKSLEANFQQVSGLAGATVLGDGTVAMIIDVPGLIRHCKGITAAHTAGNTALLPGIHT